MKEFHFTKYLPWPVGNVHEAITDIASYPALHPEIDTVHMVKDRPGYRDIEIVFNVASGAVIRDPALGLRLTEEGLHRIRAVGTKGQFQHLAMTWDLNDNPEGGTDLFFRMEYETGRGSDADMLAHRSIKTIAGEIMTHFEDHLRSLMAQRQEEQAASAAEGRQRGRKALRFENL